MTIEFEKDPPSPKKEDPLLCRLLRKTKTPSQWKKIAEEAEEKGEYGDAHHYWTAAASEHTRSHDKRKLYKKYANECLIKWREQNV